MKTLRFTLSILIISFCFGVNSVEAHSWGHKKSDKKSVNVMEVISEPLAGIQAQLDDFSAAGIYYTPILDKLLNTIYRQAEGKANVKLIIFELKLMKFFAIVGVDVDGVPIWEGWDPKNTHEILLAYIDWAIDDLEAL